MNESDRMNGPTKPERRGDPGSSGLRGERAPETVNLDAPFSHPDWAGASLAGPGDAHSHRWEGVTWGGLIFAPSPNLV